MSDMYIVTGICGHLGNTVAGLLIDRGAAVTGLRLPGEQSGMLDKSIRLVEGDVCDRASLEPLFDRAADGEATVIHCAGIITISGKRDERVERVNVGGTRNIIDACLKHRVKKLVYISSVHAIPVLGEGRTMEEISDFSPDRVSGLYARSKAEATRLVLEAAKKGLNATVVHPSGIIGPNDYGSGLLTQLISDYLKGTLTAAVRGGYDFVDVRDAAEGVVRAALNGRSGQCYILSSGYRTIAEILDTLHELTGKRRIRVYLPIWFVRLFAPFAALHFRLRHEKPLFTSESLSILVSNAKFSNRKAREELGYSTRSLYESLRDTVEFLRVGKSSLGAV